MCRKPQAASAYDAKTVYIYVEAGEYHTINLPRKLEDIVEVQLDEYAVWYAAAGSPPVPRTLMIDFGRPFDVDHSSSDTGIRGFPLVLATNGANAVHITYDNPRVVSRSNVQAVSSFQMRVQPRDNSGTSAHTAIFLALTFIVKRRGVNYELRRAAMHELQNTGFGTNDWRTESVHAVASGERASVFPYGSN